MTTQPLAVGATIAFQHGPVAVRLQRVRPAAYTVVAEQGTLRLPGLCSAFTAEPAARAHARRIAEDLVAGYLPAQIAARIRFDLAA
jgi:hypothetical protein